MASPLHSPHFWGTRFCVLGGAQSRLHGLGSSALRLQSWEPQAERQEIGSRRRSGCSPWLGLQAGGCLALQRVPAHSLVHKEFQHYYTSLQLLFTTPLARAPSAANPGKPHWPSNLLSPAHTFVYSSLNFVKASLNSADRPPGGHHVGSGGVPPNPPQGSPLTKSPWGRYACSFHSGEKI